MTPLLWMLVGVLAVHVCYAILLLICWAWMAREQRFRDALNRDIQLVRDAVRTPPKRRKSDAEPRDVHRW